MAITTAISPDLSEAVCVVKKAVFPLVSSGSTTPPTTGQIWPRPK